MGTRLDGWAETGDYEEEPEPTPVPAPGRWSGKAWRLENAPAAALVPIGIIVGSLMAVACVVRLCMLPLELAAGRGKAEAEDERYPEGCC